jgi:hypothetical protein
MPAHYSQGYLAHIRLGKQAIMWIIKRSSRRIHESMQAPDQSVAASTRNLVHIGQRVDEMVATTVTHATSY